MIELNLPRTSLRWDFSFFAVLALFFSLDGTGFGLNALGICAAHELAHLAVMLLCGIIPECVTFYGAGIRITSAETERHSPAEQAAVYGAGCVMNFLLAAALFAAGKPYPAAVSLSCGLFNLLPVGEFDGRRLLKLALIKALRGRLGIFCGRCPFPCRRKGKSHAHYNLRIFIADVRQELVK